MAVEPCVVKIFLLWPLPQLWGSLFTQLVTYLHCLWWAVSYELVSSTSLGTSQAGAQSAVGVRSELGECSELARNSPSSSSLSEPLNLAHLRGTFSSDTAEVRQEQVWPTILRSEDPFPVMAQALSTSSQFSLKCLGSFQLKRGTSQGMTGSRNAVLVAFLTTLSFLPWAGASC